MAKKKDTAGYTRLQGELAQGRPGRLYIFHGEESYLRDYYLEELRKALIPDGMEAFNHHLLPGKDLTVRRLEEVVDALPMMSPRTLVVVNDYDIFKAGEREREQMTKLLEDLPEYCCLVFVYDTIEYKSDARMRKLAGAIKTHGLVVEFGRQENKELVKWVRRRFQALGKDIRPQEAEYLLVLCGDLMNGLITEIEKIAAYAKEPQVSRRDIDTVAVPIIQAVVFKMTEALTQGRTEEALTILRNLFLRQEEPIVILAILGKHIRQLYAARVVLDRGKGVKVLMELWGLRYSFQGETLMRTARRHDQDWCRWAMARCAQTDLAMKSVSGADSQELLLSLILELAAGGRV